MTNVKIGYPDIPFHSISFDQSVDYVQPYNLVHGRATTRSYSESVATTLDFDFNLGSDFANKQNTSDFIYLHRADLLQNDNITDLELFNASIFGSWTSIYSDTTFDSATLRGPRSTDYIGTFSTSTARQYWRVNLAVTSSNSNMCFSKLFFGTLWDPDIEPDYTLDLITPKETGWISDSGVRYMQKEGEPHYEARMIWRGVSDADTQTFSNNIARYAHISPVVLFTADYHDVLDDHRVIYSKLVDAKITRSELADYNTIEARFVEDVG